MADGVRAASVWASFGVTTTDWTKGLNKMVDDTVKTLKKIEGAGAKLGQLGAVMGASIAGAIKVASASSPQLTKSLEEIKKAGVALATDIGVQFVPMMQSLAVSVRQATSFFQSLSPEVKQTAAQVAGYGTAALLAAGALGKLSGFAAAALEGTKLAATAMLGAFRGLALMVGGISLPVLAVIAVIGVLVLAAGAFYKAWNTAGNGFRETVAGILETIKGWGQSIADFFGNLWEGVTGFIRKAATFVLDQVALNIRALGIMLSKVADLLPDSMGSKLSSWADSMKSVTGASLMGNIQDGAQFVWSKITDGASYLASKAVVVGSTIGDAILYAADGLKMAAADAARRIKAAFGGSGGGSGATVKDTSKASAEAQSYGNGLVLADWMSRDDKVRAQLRYQDEQNRLSKAMSNTRSSAEKLAQGFGRLMGSIGQKFLSRMGSVGSIIQSGIEGGATAGPWGALIAVIADLLSRAQGFTDIVAMMEIGVKKFADFFGSIFEGLKGITALSTDGIEDALKPLQHLIDIIGTIFEKLQPVFVALNGLFKALGALSDAMNVLTAPIHWLIDKVFRAFYEVVRALAVGIMWVIVQVGNIWNGMLGGIRNFLDLYYNQMLGNMGGIGDAMLAWFDNTFGTIDNSQLKKDMDDLSVLTFDQAMAVAAESVDRLTPPVEDAAAAAERLAQSLTNIPAGFKVALAQFNAIATGDSAPNAITAVRPVEVPMMANGGIVRRATQAIIGEAGPEAVIPLGRLEQMLSAPKDGAGTVNVTIVSNDPEVIWKKLKPLMRRDGWRGSL